MMGRKLIEVLFLWINGQSRICHGRRCRGEIEDGVVFWGFEDGGELVGVMGIQKVRDVTLIRHAYVRSEWQKRGIGAQLLAHLRGLTEDPILIGTWADAVWAIHFYEKHGFRMVGVAEKDRLLKKYWKISERQRETSVVLADSKWRGIEGWIRRSFVIRANQISNECFLLLGDFVGITISAP